MTISPTGRSGDGARPTRVDVAIAAAIALTALIAFWAVLDNGFVDFDDTGYIEQNQVVQDGFTWEGVRWALGLSGDAVSYWQPLTLLSLMADVALFGVSARATHAVNLALHVLAALLVYALLLRTTGARWRSAVVALIFAIHPLQVESVAWAVERKNVLSAVFALGALLAYAGYARAPGVRRMAAVVALTAASFCAKASVAPLPALFLLLDVWPLGRTRWAAPARADWPVRRQSPAGLLLEKAPLFALVAAISLIVSRTSGTHPETTPFGLRIETAILGYAQYLGRLFWPARLGVFYPQPGSIHWSAWGGALLLLAVTTWAVALHARRAPAPLVGWLWFCGMLVPASGLIRSGLWPATADRFVYLPVIGLLVALVWGLAEWIPLAGRRRAAVAPLVAVITVGLALQTREQVGFWKDTESLFLHTASLSEGNTPGNAVALVNLGKVYERAGRVDEALAAYDWVLSGNPWDPKALVNRGVILHSRGDLAGAEAHYRRALERSPSEPDALYDMGLLAKARDGAAAALPWFERAVASGLRLADGYNQLANCYRSVGRPRDAERMFREALLRDRKHWHAAVNLARLLTTEGRLAEARELLAEGRRRAMASGERASDYDRVTGGLGVSGQ